MTQVGEGDGVGVRDLDSVTDRVEDRDGDVEELLDALQAT
jgi:hypothetical protein